MRACFLWLRWKALNVLAKAFLVPAEFFGARAKACEAERARLTR